MTAFTKENLIKEGKYLTYMPNGYATPYADRKFVARFRTAGIGSFATHLRKKWTVEDYFAKMEEGLAPLKIVELTGYISPNVKKLLKQGGYPLTLTGRKQMIRDQVKAWEARQAAQAPKYVECPNGNGFIRVRK